MKFATALLFALITASHANASIETTLLAKCDETLLFKVSIIFPELVTEKYFVEMPNGESSDVEKVEYEDVTNFRFAIEGVEQTITRSYERDGMDGKFIYRRNGAKCNSWIVQPL